MARRPRDNISSDAENLVGSRFGDTLEGSDTTQFERYDGQAGNDTMNGRGGPEISQAGAAPDGADKVFGGGGLVDTMSYEQRTARVDLTVNFFDNDDGQAGEGDTVREIESVIGGKAGDVIAGSGSTTAALSLFGGPGIDRLTGTAGDDTLCGEAGGDAIVGRGGNDTIPAIDRELDTLFCGDGIDTANRDLREKEVLGCEGGIVQP